MCLGVPGQIIEIDSTGGLPVAVVDFGGVRREVCIAYTPDAKVCDYVVVHVGFAIAILDEQAAQEAIATLRNLATAGEAP